MGRRKSTDPFLLFAILSFLSSLVLDGIVYNHYEGFSIDNIQPHITLTFSISLFSTFIPLVFAAITYGKNRLSQTAPEIFAELSIDNKILLAFIELGVLFSFSLGSTLLKMQNNWYAFLQLCLIFCSFILSAFFVWGIISVSKYSNLLPFFGTTAQKELKKHILKNNTAENDYVKKRAKNIIENFVTMANVHINRGSREDLEITLEELQSYVCYIFEIINRNLTEIKDPTVYYSQQEIYKNLKRIERLEDIHKKISDLLLVEVSKLVHSISNEREEKYLESFVPLLKAIMPGILSVDTVYHSIQWSTFINDTTLRTVSLKHTTYVYDAIDLYEELIECDFRKDSSSAAYGTCLSLRGLLKALDILKSKEASLKLWYNGLQARIVNLVLGMLPLCTKYDCDTPIIQNWADSLIETVSDIYPKDNNTFLDGNPVSVIVQPNSQDSLPFVYQQAAGNILRSDYDSQTKIMQLHTLLPVYSIYPFLIDKSSDHPGDFSLCLSYQLFVDLQICSKIQGDLNEWIDSVSEEYKKIFTALKNHYTNKQIRTNFFELQYAMAMPAIALISKHANQMRFADRVLDCFSEMLIDIFSGNEPKSANGWERANILLLSSWLKKTGRLPEKLNGLESILREYPYSNYSSYMSDYEASGYPRITYSGVWRFPPSLVWPDNIQELVNTELMDLDFLIKYGKQFVAKIN